MPLFFPYGCRLSVQDTALQRTKTKEVKKVRVIGKSFQNQNWQGEEGGHPDLCPALNSGPLSDLQLQLQYSTQSDLKYLLKPRWTQEVGRIAFKPPPFWETDPNLGFIRVESQFTVSGITSDKTKFHSVVAVVDA
ncbi:hypothetical protein TNCV_2276541 [Trichonephila clavipes]|nr:hypothetical protein TNCV_2276541 [Trichonephila clavipes]